MYTVFSGMQPTGSLHLGNYVGAIKKWLDLQINYQCVFCIVDMHAITMPYDPSLLSESVYKTLAAYIASGIDVEKNILFCQSDVREHTELAWLLSCVVQYGKLNGMIQFKEKAGKNKEKVSLGLYTYPVLMAADILLYKAEYVPVGEDQLQHLELTREIAGIFNHRYNVDYFNKPNALVNKFGARIMSLKNGQNKMSKSDISDYSRINLVDDAKTIAEKISKATTDQYSEILYDPVNRPEISNLINIYSILTKKDIKDVEKQFVGSNYSSFKKELSDVLIDSILPIAKKTEDLLQNKTYLNSILSSGAERAREIAAKNIKEIKKIMGIYR